MPRLRLSAMKLYGHPISGNVHRVKALLHLLGVEFEDIVLDLPKRAHKAPEFLALNPLGQVPVLEDGELVLRDSTAILIYLAQTQDPARTWLPQAPATQARIQQWLSTSVNEIWAGPAALRAVRLFGAPRDYDAAWTRTEAVFGDLFEPHLMRSEWLVGTGPTIADLACYSYVARAPEGDFGLDAYPALRTWLARVEAIDGFLPMVHAADLLGERRS